MSYWGPLCNKQKVTVMLPTDDHSTQYIASNVEVLFVSMFYKTDRQQDRQTTVIPPWPCPLTVGPLSGVPGSSRGWGSCGRLPGYWPPGHGRQRPRLAGRLPGESKHPNKIGRTYCTNGLHIEQNVFDEWIPWEICHC